MNYHNTSVAMILLTMVFFISGLYMNNISVFLFCMIVVLYLLFLVLGAARIQMNFYLKAINHGKHDEAKVAITFDDSPDIETSGVLLDILEQHNVKATFFAIGSKISGNEKVISSIKDKGHLIGNHSWSHAFFFDFYHSAKMIREIKRTDIALEAATGEKTKFFRPPYGVTNPFLSNAIRETGHIVIGWSLRTFDTSAKRQKVLDRINTRLINGDIILFHDSNPETIEVIEEAIVLIRQKGMEIVRLDGLIGIE